MTPLHSAKLHTKLEPLTIQPSIPSRNVAQNLAIEMAPLGFVWLAKSDFITRMFHWYEFCTAEGQYKIKILYQSSFFGTDFRLHLQLPRFEDGR